MSMCVIGIVTLMDKQGWPLPKTSNVYWRIEVASLRHELDKADGPDYTFVFDHLIDVVRRHPSLSVVTIEGGLVAACTRVATTLILKLLLSMYRLRIC